MEIHMYRQLTHGNERNVVTVTTTLARNDYLIMLVLQS